MRSPHAVLLAAPSIVLFVASVFFDVLVFDDHTLSAGKVIVFGWMGIVDLQVGWLANPLVVLGWVLLFLRPQRRSSVPTILAGAALCLGVTSFYTLSYLPVNPFPNGVDHVYRFESFGPAIYLWTASQAALLAATVLQWIAHRPNAGPADSMDG
jgi:hypothetical protein